jgi:hypothetical protein
LRRARKRQHHASAEAARDFGDAVKPGGIAADIDRGVIARAHHKSDDIAGQEFDAGRAVTRGRCGNLQRAAVLGELDARSWRKAFGVAAESLGAGFGGQHALCLGQKVLAGMIEVIRMLVVAEQHRIDIADGLRLKRRPVSFSSFTCGN